MNYMQQPMLNPEDIFDPTTIMNMVLVLMAKAFKLNYSTSTNKNQRISSNPRNRQIAQPGINMGQDRQYAGQNAGNQIGYNAGQIAGNQNGYKANANPIRNGNVVAARAEGNGNGNNGNLIRCYNHRGLGHYARNYTVRPKRRDVDYLPTQLLIAQKEEAGIQLQAEEFDLMAVVGDIDEIEEVNANCILMANLHQASTSGTQTDKAHVYDSNKSAEGLGHNLFSVGQFCDSDLEATFRRITSFVRNLEGVDLLKGNRTTNLYTINLYEMASASPICLLDRATSTKSWLWHQRLSHLNFDNINYLAKNDLVTGLPKFKYSKELLCSSCEQGKSKTSPHKPKPVPNSKQRLHLLHMDLCGLMRVESINEKRTPQHNGVVERRNRTLVEAARTMLIFFLCSGVTPPKWIAAEYESGDGTS
ncbi:retrovirus-related pol polyprotein from transposon TNT 1-94 [Tanacetum coccineum]